MCTRSARLSIATCLPAAQEQMRAVRAEADIKRIGQKHKEIDVPPLEGGFDPGKIAIGQKRGPEIERRTGGLAPFHAALGQRIEHLVPKGLWFTCRQPGDLFRALNTPEIGVAESDRIDGEFGFAHGVSLCMSLSRSFARTRKRVRRAAALNGRPADQSFVRFLRSDISQTANKNVCKIFSPTKHDFAQNRNFSSIPWDRRCFYTKTQHMTANVFNQRKTCAESVCQSCPLTRG